MLPSGDEASCFEGLSTATRTAWNLAVDYYAEVISSRRWSDREQVVIRSDLTGVEELTEPRDLRFVRMARGFMQAAAPACEACRWKTQEARNREWIDALIAQLDLHEAAAGITE